MVQYRDLKEFIGAVEKMGELSVVKGADWKDPGGCAKLRVLRGRSLSAIYHLFQIL